MSTTLYRKVVVPASEASDGEPVVVEVVHTDHGTLTTIVTSSLGTVLVGYDRFDPNRAVEKAVEFCKTLKSERLAIAFAERADGAQI